jgi:hypothetical protein
LPDSKFGGETRAPINVQWQWLAEEELPQGQGAELTLHLDLVAMLQRCRDGRFVGCCRLSGLSNAIAESRLSFILRSSAAKPNLVSDKWLPQLHDQ